MIIKMKKGATESNIDKVVTRIEDYGFTPDLSQGKGTMVIGVIGETHTVSEQKFKELAGVESVLRITRPYKLVSREYSSEDRIIEFGGVKIGGKNRPVVIAGPCSVENEEQIVRIAKEVKKAGADMLRGGAYKPRSSPYSFQGLGRPGLDYMALARKESGLPIVTEATGIHYHKIDNTPEEKDVLDNVLDYTDILQIGTRNMKSYGFLQTVAERTAKSGLPVLLKRGEEATIKEFLLSAEYIAGNGNPNVILCLRGIRTFEETRWQRYTSDIAAISVLKQESNLPVLFDPSHATGDRELVRQISLAAISAGADGLLVEAHYDPENAASDGPECVTSNVIADIVEDVKLFHQHFSGRFNR
jgi:3-deoxy-7-phosphoheptulonate synthase